MKKIVVTSVLLISSLLMTACNSTPQPSSTQDKEEKFASIEKSNIEASKKEENKDTVVDENRQTKTDKRELNAETQKLNKFSSIEVDVLAADINVVSGEDWSISYKLSEKEPLQRFGVEGDTLYLETKFDETKRFDNTEDWFITITIPENTTLTEVELETISGDVNVQNFSCGEASLSSTSGDVQAENITAMEMDVNSVSGDIIAKNITSAKMDTETVSGNISAEGAFGELESSTISGDTKVSGSISAESELESTSGDIALSISNSASIFANSVGTITFNGEKVGSPLKHNDGIMITLSSVSGDITVKTA